MNKRCVFWFLVSFLVTVYAKYFSHNRKVLSWISLPPTECSFVVLHPNFEWCSTLTLGFFLSTVPQSYHFV